MRFLAHRRSGVWETIVAGQVVKPPDLPFPVSLEGW